MMNTPFVRAALTEAYGGDIAEMTRFRDARCPTGKQGESWDVAHLAVFLASDRAKYITGAEVVVDGGQTLRI
jgi:NAD(P)-dependent dehydrogenase (short-subunit alcohol dehydrogenase family)